MYKCTIYDTTCFKVVIRDGRGGAGRGYDPPPPPFNLQIYYKHQMPPSSNFLAKQLNQEFLIFNKKKKLKQEYLFATTQYSPPLPLVEILNLMVSYNEQIAEVIAKATKNVS
jgi:hypothetical protein